MKVTPFCIPTKVLEEERDLSDRDTDLEDSPDITGNSWRDEGKEEDEGPVVGVSLGRQAVCHLLAPPLERSGRETPVSVDSIPLEWDHTVDVGGSSSHEDDEDATFFSALSGNNHDPLLCSGSNFELSCQALEERKGACSGALAICNKFH